MSEMQFPEGGFTWIASYPKSGNTWVRLFLASYINNGDPVSINALPRDLCYSDSRASDFLAVAACDVSKLNHHEAAQLRGAVLVKLLTDTVVRPMFVKTHCANVSASDVVMFPRHLTTRAIHIVRDPRDVCVSFARWTESSIDEVIRVMGDKQSILENLNPSTKPVVSILGSWSMHAESWMRAPFPVMLCRYEDMVSDPVKTFGDMVDQLYADPDIEVVKKAVKSVSFSNLQKEEKRRGFHEKPAGVKEFFREGSVDQWKKVLTKEQADRIVEDHGEVMEKLGYL